MKPALSFIKCRTPESQVKLMLGRVPKRKGFENVADWVRNEFRPVLMLMTAPYCCIDTILESFLTLVGGNYRTSWEQVYRRRLKAANATVSGVNPSRSDVIPLVAADRPDLYDMFRDAAGVFKAPSFGSSRWTLLPRRRSSSSTLSRCSWSTPYGVASATPVWKRK
jgi:hypothetical protein